MICVYALPGRRVVTVGLWELVVYDRGDALAGGAGVRQPGAYSAIYGQCRISFRNWDGMPFGYGKVKTSSMQKRLERGGVATHDAQHVGPQASRPLGSGFGYSPTEGEVP